MIPSLNESNFAIEQKDHRFSIYFRYAMDAALCYRILRDEEVRYDNFTVDKPVILMEQNKRKYCVRLSWHGRVSEKDFLNRDFSRQEMQKRWRLAKR
jgi:hypothetical protein